MEVELPLGLAGATAQIKGVTENPLTRAKIELGRQLFFDKRLSSDGTISCADCHNPEQGYAAHTQFRTSVKGQSGGRNAPGRLQPASSAVRSSGTAGPPLWKSRSVVSIENPFEMANTRRKSVTTLKNIEGYRLQFEAVFPDEGVTIAAVGKAVAGFERVIVTGPAPNDYYERVLAIEQSFTAEEIQEDPVLNADYEAKLAASLAHPMSESAIRGPSPILQRTRRLLRLSRRGELHRREVPQPGNRHGPGPARTSADSK